MREKDAAEIFILRRVEPSSETYLPFPTRMPANPKALISPETDRFQYFFVAFHDSNVTRRNLDGVYIVLP